MVLEHKSRARDESLGVAPMERVGVEDEAGASRPSEESHRVLGAHEAIGVSRVLVPLERVMEQTLRARRDERGVTSRLWSRVDCMQPNEDFEAVACAVIVPEPRDVLCAACIRCEANCLVPVKNRVWSQVGPNSLQDRAVREERGKGWQVHTRRQARAVGGDGRDGGVGLCKGGVDRLLDCVDIKPEVVDCGQPLLLQPARDRSGGRVVSLERLDCLQFANGLVEVPHDVDTWRQVQVA